MDEKVKIAIITIDNDIRELQLQREELLSTQNLTTKEHYEFYHG